MRTDRKVAVAGVLLLLGETLSLSSLFGANNNNNDNRRAFLNQGAVLASAMAGASSCNAAAPSVEIVDVYFGCGCFWHVQHEFVQAERPILGRRDSDLSARAGYAEGKAGSLDNKVCYHNSLQVSDYGKLGHAEVVRLQIPTWSYKDFATEYCRLFSDKGYRPDQFDDRGAEYRNLVGVPGGVDSPLARILVQQSQASGDKLNFAEGNGNDADYRALVWIMDSNQFPFFVAEQYHQFHDGFNLGENYPSDYNVLASVLQRQGTLGKSDCPNNV